MALERLTPTCVSGRGDVVIGEASNVRVNEGEVNVKDTRGSSRTGRWPSAEYILARAKETASNVAANLEQSKDLVACVVGMLRKEKQRATTARNDIMTRVDAGGISKAATCTSHPEKM